MIEANELRLNNYILINSKISKIFSISNEGINMSIDNLGHSPINEFEKLSDCEGIPLTPELLVKCGFEQREEIVWDLVHNYRSIRIVLYKNSKTFTFPCHTNGLITLKFLHQLQNLILALTSKELEIKELV